MCPSDHDAASRELRPSHTAQIAALFRAVHQISQTGPKLLNDTLARPLLGFQSDSALIEDFRSKPVSRFPEFINLFALRSRYAEDELEAAFERGTDQYVILGAGLDSFAHRRPENLRQIHVFEVDSAITQSWKRTRLKELGVSEPPNLRYVGADFETEDLSRHLIDCGLDRKRPILFSLLGVMQYINGTTLAKLLSELPTLSDVACTLIMENVIPPGMVDPDERASLDFVMAGSASKGEPWRTFLSVDDAAVLLRASGFAEVDLLDRRSLQSRYFGSRPDLVLPPRYAPLLRADTGRG